MNASPRISTQKPFTMVIAGSAMYLLASYIRYFTTGSLKVDENYLTKMLIYLIISLLLVGLVLSGYAYFKTIFRQDHFDLNSRQTRSLAVILLLLTIPILLVLSNNIFNLFTWGDLAFMMDFMHIPERHFPLLVTAPHFLVGCIFIWKFRKRLIDFQFSPDLVSNQVNIRMGSIPLSRANNFATKQ